MFFNLLYPFWMLLSPTLSFGAANDAKISQLSYDFALRLVIFCWLCRVFLKLNVLVVSGRRSAAQQDALHAADKRNPPASTGSSHMRGDAADLNFLQGGLNVLRKADPPAKWAKVYALADLCGIKNGHAFNGYADNNHFFID